MREFLCGSYGRLRHSRHAEYVTPPRVLAALAVVVVVAGIILLPNLLDGDPKSATAPVVIGDEREEDSEVEDARKRGGAEGGRGEKDAAEPRRNGARDSESQRSSGTAESRPAPTPAPASPTPATATPPGGSPSGGGSGGSSGGGGAPAPQPSPPPPTPAPIPEDDDFGEDGDDGSDDGGSDD